MTKIIYEKNGINIEQKYNKWSQKRFVDFDDINIQVGYKKTQDYVSLLFGVFIIVLGIAMYISSHKIINLCAFLIIGGYSLYNSLSNFSNFIILSISRHNDLYFSQKDKSYIDEIINKRNEYYLKRYYQNINDYDNQNKINIIN